MNKIGITAPRVGLSPLQDDVLHILLGALRANGAASNSRQEFHHGCCVGGDERAAAIAHWLNYRTVSHDPLKPDWRGTFRSDEHREPRGYLARDRALVDEVDLLIGLPDRDTWRPSSGTWYTIGYAQRQGTPRIVVGSTGTLIDLAGVPAALERVVRYTLVVVVRARAVTTECELGTQQETA